MGAVMVEPARDVLCVRCSVFVFNSSPEQFRVDSTTFNHYTVGGMSLVRVSYASGFCSDEKDEPHLLYRYLPRGKRSV